MLRVTPNGCSTRAFLCLVQTLLLLSDWLSTNMIKIVQDKSITLHLFPCFQWICHWTYHCFYWKYLWNTRIHPDQAKPCLVRGRSGLLRPAHRALRSFSDLLRIDWHYSKKCLDRKYCPSHQRKIFQSHSPILNDDSVRVACLIHLVYMRIYVNWRTVHV